MGLVRDQPISPRGSDDHDPCRRCYYTAHENCKLYMIAKYVCGVLGRVPLCDWSLIFHQTRASVRVGHSCLIPEVHAVHCGARAATMEYRTPPPLAPAPSPYSFPAPVLRTHVANCCRFCLRSLSCPSTMMANHAMKLLSGASPLLAPAKAVLPVISQLADLYCTPFGCVALLSTTGNSSEFRKPRHGGAAPEISQMGRSQPDSRSAAGGSHSTASICVELGQQHY